MSHRNSFFKSYLQNIARLLFGSKLTLLSLSLMLLAFFLFYEWRRWIVTVPKPMPQHLEGEAEKSNTLLGGRYYEVAIPPTGSAQYISADYRLWIPKDVKVLRGVIIKQHGCGGDATTEIGLSHANDLQWQALALKHQLALLGTKFPTDYQTKGRYLDDPCNSWALIDRGSEKALLTAFHQFAQKAQHPELDKVPWVLWGYSGGADWAMQMAQKYPERTIAMVLARGGAVLVSDTEESSLILNAKISSAFLKVPVLFALGEKDPHTEEAVKIPEKIFYQYRKAGAVWAIAKESEAGHANAETRLLAIPFLDAILSARLTASEGILHSIDSTQGWLGNPTTHTIAPIAEYEGNPLEAAWLPNEETAHKWQAYITTPSLWEQVRYKLCSSQKIGILLGASYLIDSCRFNKIAPAQKPNAPFNVRVKKTEREEIVLKWNFKPDLENGLPPFRIYRDNSLIATLQGQGYDGGDAPILSNITLEFRDKKAAMNSSYFISAFNTLGESVSQPTD
jgi:pimeloyl-ACP methyl ester carboxylesterase